VAREAEHLPSIELNALSSNLLAEGGWLMKRGGAQLKSIEFCPFKRLLVHGCNPNTPEVEEGRSGDQGQPGLGS
jgi:hypothetical protein